MQVTFFISLTIFDPCQLPGEKCRGSDSCLLTAFAVAGLGAFGSAKAGERMKGEKTPSKGDAWLV